MRKITITNNRKQTLVIYVADHALAHVKPAIQDDELYTVLQNLSVQILEKLSSSKKFPQLPLYIERINLDAQPPTAVVYLQPDQDSVTAYEVKLGELRSPGAADLSQLGIEKWNIEECDANSAEFAATKFAVKCAQASPPISKQDSTLEITPPEESDIRSQYELLLTYMLNENTDPKPLEEARQIAATITQYSVATLQAVRDQYLELDGENVPPAILDQLAELNKNIEAKVKYVTNSNEFKALIRQMSSYIMDEHQREQALSQLACALHNAARDFYATKWKELRGNISAINKFREQFNILFAEIAAINEDGSLSTVEYAQQKLANKTTAEISVLLSNLVNASYRQDAFKCIADRLNACPNFVAKIEKQKLKHEIKLSDELIATLEKPVHQKQTLKECPIRVLDKIVREIEDSKSFVAEKATAINDMLHPAPVPKQPNIFQRNKATFISLGIGIVVAAGVGVGIFFAPITLSVVATALIIAGAAAAVIGISALIGRLIDRCKNSPKGIARAAERENERLLDGFDHYFEPGQSDVVVHRTLASNPPVSGTTPPSHKSGSRHEAPLNTDGLATNHLLAGRTTVAKQTGATEQKTFRPN